MWSRVLTTFLLLGGSLLPACTGSGEHPSTGDGRNHASTPALGALFKVAAWNLRGGSGAQGFADAPPFDSNTGNCTDPAQPLNAWGRGFTQQFLLSDVAADPAIVALGASESWGCAQGKNVNAVLGWKAFSRGYNGTTLYARHGISGEWDVHRIEQAGVDGMTESRYIVGANVCLVPDCTRTLYMWAAHLAPPTDAKWSAHVRKVLAYLGTKPQPHLWMGDLNLWRNDRWSPRVRCGTATPAMTQALDLVDRAGYIDAWKATQSAPGWTGMQSRSTGRLGCGRFWNGGLYKRIDYVLSKGIRPTASALFATVDPGAPAPSDHAGILATFPMPAAAPAAPD